MMKDIFLLFLLGTSWGLSFSVLKVLTDYEHTDILIVMISMFFAFLALVSVQFKHIRLTALKQKSVVSFAVVCSLSAFVLPLILELHVLSFFDLSLVSVVVSTAPIFAVIFFWLSGSDRLNIKLVLAVILGLFACLLALYSKGAFEDEHFKIQQLDALLWLLLIPACYGFYHYFVEVRWPHGLRPSELASMELLACSLLCIPVLAVVDTQIINIDLNWWMWVLALGFMTALEAVLYFKVQANRGAVFCSIADYIATISGVLAGAIFFLEQTSWIIVVSIVLVISASWLCHRDEPSVQVQ